jgi:N-acylneuraminate cytidylyltransferase
MNVAFIPARGGSKSIPLKNIRQIAGKPLLYWATAAACRCRDIDRVYISTDHEEIRRTALSFGFENVEVIGRSVESASDTASTECAMLEFAHKYQFDSIVLIQATSPLITSEDLDNGWREYQNPNVDSVLSVVLQKRFIWAKGTGMYAAPVNYEYLQRPRRQEFEGYYVENGAFYITSRESLLQTGCRLSGNIQTVEMREDSFVEIDEPGDWEIVESLMKKNGIKAQEENIPQIRMFLTDCDGCLTDGGMYYSEHGDELKKFNTRDGAAFELLQQSGVLTGIITGEDMKLNRRRAQKLNLDILECGVKDKSETVKRICAERGIGLENVAYVGDDINDAEIMRMVGFPCCPADAICTVRGIAKYVAKAKGGGGAVREIAEYMLAIQKMSSEYKLVY